MNDPIKAKIQELCPDVMELKFGSLVLWHVSGGEKICFVLRPPAVPDDWKKVRTNNFHKIVIVPLGNVAAYWVHPEDVELLGSPITLAVVLRAIEKSNIGGTLFIDTSGQWYGKNSQLKLAESGYLHRKLNWNLFKDYDGQTEETKKFIGNLLGV